MRHDKHFFSLAFFAILIAIGFSLDQNGMQVSGITGHFNPFYNTAEAAQLASKVTPGSPSDKNKGTTLVGEGKASYYSDQFHGRKTANGETFNMNKLTAAHPSLPFGTWVRVTNLSNGKDVVVRINDRGPFVKGRIIDLSVHAATELGIIQSGTVKVKLEALGSGRLASSAG
ncbi:MAG: septal ring lytic transglycosylase RlpA family protein [Chlorobium sp.]|jgi:rare lipoprotein A|nr:MAG: septal ring lytic transglycosylase RlpA family protein [Chlorobium sp.]